MNDAVRRGDKEAVEVLAQWLNLIAPRHTMHFQKGCRGFRVVCFQLQPDIRMTQVRDLVDPEAVPAELGNAGIPFLFNLKQPQSVTIKRNRLGLFWTGAR